MQQPGATWENPPQQAEGCQNDDVTLFTDPNIVLLQMLGCFAAADP